MLICLPPPPLCIFCMCCSKLFWLEDDLVQKVESVSFSLTEKNVQIIKSNKFEERICPISASVSWEQSYFHLGK